MKLVTLTCEVGPHPWERESQRGRRPRTCPTHSALKTLDGSTASAVSLVTGVPEAQLDDFGGLPKEDDLYPIVCWVDPDYVAPDPRADQLTKEAVALQRVIELEISLRARGTHISQHS